MRTGALSLHPLSDGTFVARAEYFGASGSPGSRPELFSRDDAAWPAGRTPGHLCVVISSGERRALLLGDAITCPIQLDEPAWHSMGDVDPVLAARIRERMWQELEDEHTISVGAHFPELEFGRLRTGTVRRWCCQAGWNGRGQR
jgi:glyoxylase-like metal-dependent hydrolase (beta-lactamase superfamily II)